MLITNSIPLLLRNRSQSSPVNATPVHAEPTSAREPDLPEAIPAMVRHLSETAIRTADHEAALDQELQQECSESRELTHSARQALAHYNTVNNSTCMQTKAATPLSTTPTHQKTIDAEGYKIMVSRLFGLVESRVADGTHGMGLQNIGRSPFEFLNQQDRNLLSHIYAFAQEQGADANYVDALATDLGDYRQHDNGRVSGNMNEGLSYDGLGRRLSVSFTEASATLVERIKNGAAIKSTSLDKGFLDFTLDPGFRPYNNHSDLIFLEQIVIKFSNEGQRAHTLDSRFATFAPDYDTKDKEVQACETTRTVSTEESHLICTDGVWTVTARGTSAGFILDPITGTPKKVKKTAAGSLKTDTSLQAFTGKKSEKSRLRSVFDYLLMKIKILGFVRKVLPHTT